MNTMIFPFFLFGWLIVSVLWLTSLIAPKSRIFNSLGKRFKGRKKLSALLLPVSIGLFILTGITAPTTTAKLDHINLQKDQEVIVDNYVIEGKISGSNAALKINNEDVVITNGVFSKNYNLAPGSNKFNILLTGKNDDGKDVEVYNQVRTIYFDYEGMLYAREQESDVRAQKELEQKVAEIPKYEIVRKSDSEEGSFGVLYFEGESEDYLISNAVKSARSSNSKNTNLTMLVFNKSDKETVEAIFESSDLAKLFPYIRANYEKRDSQEELFWFPDGAEGKKIALEL